MVENVANDGVEPKLAIIEASRDVKPTVNVKFKSKFPFKLILKKNLNRYLQVFSRFVVLK